MKHKILSLLYLIFLTGSCLLASTSLLAKKQVDQDTIWHQLLLHQAAEELNHNLDSAIVLGQHAFKLATRLRDADRQLQSVQFLVDASLLHQVKPDELSTYYLQLNQIDSTQLSRKEKVTLHGIWARLHFSNSKYHAANEAIKEQFHALEGFDFPDGEARANFLLADLHYVREEYPQANNYYKSALQNFIKAKNNKCIAQSYNSIAKTFGQMGLYKLTLRYDSLALDMLDTTKATYINSATLIDASIASLKTDKKAEANSLVTKALFLAKEIDNPFLIARAYNQLGRLRQHDKEPIKAAFFYKKANQIAEQLKEPSLLKENYALMYQFYAEENEYKEAFQYLQKLEDLKLRLNKNIKHEQELSYNLQIETEKKQAERHFIRAFEKEQKMAFDRHKGLTLNLSIIALLSVFLAILLYKSHKAKYHYNQQLEAEVKARTKDLKVAIEKLKQSNLELERFAYIASHDLKSPLRNIVSFLGLSQRKIKSHNYKGIEEYIRFASDNANQMYTLIQDVLEYSKVNNQSMTGWEKEVNLNEILANVIYNIDSDIKQKNAEILTCPLPIVKGSKVHLMQLFQNLITNGIKYNENETPTVQLSHEETIDEHIIRINDNGIGIEKQYQDQVFEMFKRLHTQTKYAGTGLGLSICKKVIQDMKGKIWLESTPSEGTTFYIAIPKMPIQVMADQN